jgi:hypothetical protein
MRLIIFQERKGNRYFDASTLGRLDQACRFILQERLNAGMYDVGDFPTPPENVSDEVLNSLSEEGRMQDGKKHEEYKKLLDSYYRFKKLKGSIEELLSRKSELVESKSLKETVPESLPLLLEYSSREQHAVYLENIKPLS